MGSVRLHRIQTVESNTLIVCREHILFVLLSASCARAISCTPTCKKNRSKNKQIEQTIGRMNRLKNIIDFLAATLRLVFGISCMYMCGQFLSYMVKFLECPQTADFNAYMESSSLGLTNN